MLNIFYNKPINQLIISFSKLNVAQKLKFTPKVLLPDFKLTS